MKKKKLDFSAAMTAYLMPYIGVMTILCIFFLIQYADYSERLKKKNAERNENIALKVKEDLKDMENVKVEVMEDGIKVTLPSSVVFDLSVARLKDAALPTLSNFAESIKKLDALYLVSVEGHTDNAPVFYGGDFSSNWELSLYRAISVIDFLVQQGNDPGRFAAAGHGEFKPLFPNDTPEHQAENRRVEIIIRRKTTAAAPVAAIAGAAPIPAALKATGKADQGEPI
ncbi:MAG: OmpA family protein [Elusimicrobiales bacterium]|nr:OmpA family protein [Elusimicrobiales bacterium]